MMPFVGVKSWQQKNPDYSVGLYRQEIARTATVKFVKYLTAYKSSGSDNDIDQCR